MASHQPTSGAKQPFEPKGQGEGASYRLAFEESIRTLASLDTLGERIRTRYVGLLAVAGASTAFLAGTVVNGVERSASFFVLAGLATVAFLSAVALALIDLWPREREGGVDATTIVRDYIEAEVPASTELTLALLATENSEEADILEARLNGMSKRFSAFVVLIAISMTMWIAVAWTSTRLVAPLGH